MLSNQKHPLHRHKRKEETFQVLYGTLYSTLNGKRNILREGDKLLVRPNVWHKFHTDKKGCIFEEVSTTHYSDDSFYKDKEIQKKTKNERKTYIQKWDQFDVRDKFYKIF